MTLPVVNARATFLVYVELSRLRILILASPSYTPFVSFTL